ncbi:MAG: glycosyltransferase family 2 protein [Deltaproteobacteria bacterium]|nr:glycosyltransferase family 2 protein [Deltaproteobacteria bacterium]
MPGKPLISAIIIFWNEERFIEEAIQSVFAQTYDHWELLLVDDGSSDSSSEIARRCTEQHPDRVRYLEHRGHENRGMSASRNLGVRSAKGRYISYLDGDDVWLPNKLADQVAIMESHPTADMVIAPLQMWFSWTGNSQDQHLDQPYGVGKNGKHPYSDTLVEPPRLLALFLRYEQYIPSGFLAKRDVMAQNGSYEEDFRDAYSDAVVLVKICLKSPVFVSGKRWYLYRKHAASSTYLSRLHGKEDEEQQIYLNWVAAYFNQQKVQDPELRTILRKMLFRCRHPLLQRLERNFYYYTSEALQYVKRTYWFLINLQRKKSLHTQTGKSDYE